MQTKRPEALKPLTQFQHPGSNKKVLVIIYSIVFIFFIFCGFGGGILLKWYSELPSLKQLENIEPNLVTKVFSADSVLLKEYYIERRFIVPYEKLPKNLVNAVIAAEDRDFYRHWGLSLRRIFAAMIKDLRVMRMAQGASTITQQLSRNLFLSSKKSLVRKVKEAMTAVQIEKRYTKKEIMEFYLNQVYMGGGIYGVQAASRKYFNKNVSEISLAESALLASVFRRPEAFRPDKQRNLKRVRKRRNWVLKSMKDLGTISLQEYNKTVKEPVRIDTTRKKELSTAPYFTEMVRKYLERKYGTRKLYTAGFSVYTTLRYNAQNAAKDSLRRNLKRIQHNINKQYITKYHLNKKLEISFEDLTESIDSIQAANPKLLKTMKLVPDSARNLRIAQAALVALDTKTGAIVAMIGGRSFAESEFNRATQAMRQPGSAFKPFVYTAAIDKGYAPSSVILDQPLSLKTATGVWRPENYDKKFSGRVTLRRALQKSINVVAIQLINELKPRVVISYARRMGIHSPLNPVLGIAIGVCEVTPLEITSSYSVFGNSGIREEPYFIEKIVNKDGNIIEEHRPKEREVLSPQTAYIMASMLQSVVKHGTGYRSRFPGGFLRPAGGKTGTTNDYTDAWFVGFTPQITCGVWVGIDNKRTLGRSETGSKAALPIWTAYMKAAHANLPEENFEEPPGIVRRKVCTESWLLARPTCPKHVEEIFTEESKPIDSCNISHFKKAKRKNQRLF